MHFLTLSLCVYFWIDKPHKTQVTISIIFLSGNHESQIFFLTFSVVAAAFLLCHTFFDIMRFAVNRVLLVSAAAVFSCSSLSLFLILNGKLLYSKTAKLNRLNDKHTHKLWTFEFSDIDEEEKTESFSIRYLCTFLSLSPSLFVFQLNFILLLFGFDFWWIIVSKNEFGIDTVDVYTVIFFSIQSNNLSHTKSKIEGIFHRSPWFHPLHSSSCMRFNTRRQEKWIQTIKEYF